MRVRDLRTGRVFGARLDMLMTRAYLQWDDRLADPDGQPLLMPSPAPHVRFEDELAEAKSAGFFQTDTPPLAS